MREQVEALEHDADVLAQRVEIDAPPRHPFAVQPDLALLDRLQRVHATQQGRLSGTRGTDEADDLVFIDAEIDTTQYFVAAEILVHVVQLEKGAHCACVLSLSRLMR